MSAAFIVVIALVFIIGLAFGGGLIWFLLRRQKLVKPAGETRPIIKKATVLRFYLGLVALPLTLFLLCSILVVAFYPSLPPEVAYRFNSTGVAKGWLGREAFVAVMLGAQLIFLLASWVIAAAVTRIGQKMLESSRFPANLADGQHGILTSDYCRFHHSRCHNFRPLSTACHDPVAIRLAGHRPGQHCFDHTAHAIYQAVSKRPCIKEKDIG
jgi:hypothetical protein